MENTSNGFQVGPSGDQLDTSPMMEEVKPTGEAVKNEIWKNFGRIASAARPDRKVLTSSSLVDGRTGMSDAEATKLTTPTGQEILLDDLLGWDVSHWSDWHSEVVGFSPEKTKTVKKPSRDVQLQTTPIVKKNTGSGGDGYGHVKTQTDFGELEPTSQDGLTIFNEPYPSSLVAFVKRVVPDMIEAIKENLIDFGYFGQPERAELAPNSKEEKEAKFAVLRSKTPTLSHRLRSASIPTGVESSCVSWSPSGTQVAVAHGALRHEGFCKHEAVPLTIWALTGSLLRLGPLHEIPFDGCITSAQFHPKLNNFLAFGFYNGDVGLIDLNGEDKQTFGLDAEVMGTGDATAMNATLHEYKHKGTYVVINTLGHTQAVTSLRWVHFNPDDAQKLVRKKWNFHSYFVVSTSSDGSISLWSVSKMTGRLRLERRYAIHARSIPDSFKRNNRTNFLHMKEIGIQSLDVFRDDSTKFVCSTDGSFLFCGNLLTKSVYVEGELLLGRQGSQEISDPEAVFIKQEADFVQSVSCNPFHDSLFIYATLHGNMYIRNTKFIDGDPILETCFPKQGTYDVKWSSTRPMVFGVLNDNKAYVYDLLLEERSEVLTLEHGAICRFLDWSKTEIRFLSVTDSDGYVNIWNLPEELVQYDPTEVAALGNYAELKETTAPLDPKETDEVDEASDDEEFATLDAMTRAHFPLLNTSAHDGQTTDEE